jgi:cytochrome c peroxidase
MARTRLAPIAAPAPAGDALSALRIELGRRLFFETAESVDGKTGCQTCHHPELYGADRAAKTVGVLGRLHARNAPTVFNAGSQLIQHWRGDRESLEDQAVRALTGPVSAGNKTPREAMERLAKAGYEPLFRAAFPEAREPLNETSFGVAISAFERTLTTPGRFDRFLEGEDDVLSEQERRGLDTFLTLGCATCHDGPALGGGRFARFGVVEPYWDATGAHEHDQGRFDVTHVEGDRDVFKVPTLRNVAETSPYFHDGSVATLREAIDVMARVQLGLRLSGVQRDDLEAFLRSLTGSLPANFSAP